MKSAEKRTVSYTHTSTSEKYTLPRLEARLSGAAWRKYGALSSAYPLRVVRMALGAHVLARRRTKHAHAPISSRRLQPQVKAARYSRRRRPQPQAKAAGSGRMLRPQT